MTSPEPVVVGIDGERRTGEPGPAMLPEHAFVVRSRQMALPDGVRPGSREIAGAVLQDVLPFDAPARELPVVDAGSAVVMAGIVDAHVLPLPSEGTPFLLRGSYSACDPN